MIWYFYQINQINPNDDYDDIDWTPSSLGFNIFVTDDEQWLGLEPPLASTLSAAEHPKDDSL